jgi:type II secretory pathway pseudopilin PulG
MKVQRSLRPACSGFSLLELLIVASLCAVVFTSGALAYRAVAQNQRRSTTFQEVALTSTAASNFFPGTTNTTIDSYTAPSFGRAALAQQMRNLFHEDVESASAVFPLARYANAPPTAGTPQPATGLLNTIRERVITIGSRQPAAYDTPAAFLSLLAELPGTTARANVFQNYRGTPADSVTIAGTPRYITNGSIFILQPSGSPTEIWIRAVYEIDYVSFLDRATRPCVYASVRRYVSEVLTHYYDVVFRESSLQDVGIPFVHFERGLRTNVVEAAVTPFKAAGNHPFYLVWWPDPAAYRLRGTTVGSYTGLRQANYAKHEGQTSLSFVVPQFPCF